MGPLGKDHTATVTALRLEDGNLASKRSIRHNAVSAACQPRPPLSLVSGWGHVQTSRTGSTLVMPGIGLINERDYTSAERAALE
jgi:hypothetical protein